MASKLKFSDGEKVLCFHGPLLYEAKCIKSQTKDGNARYFVHYSGWNKHWDEWVPEIRVLKINDDNLQKQKDLAAAHGNAKKGKAAVKTGSVKEAPDKELSALSLQEKTPKQKVKEVVPPENQMKKGNRTRAEPSIETEEEYVQKVVIDIRIPDELKHWLVDDWNLINRQKKLLQLPARVPVDTILAVYLKKPSVKELTPNKETAMLETANGIKEYFNAMLGKRLLYDFERPQYSDLMFENPVSNPSKLYGAVHLLRLFTKIGEPLSFTTLDEDDINILSVNLHDFLKYMSKSSSTLFSFKDYVNASPEYLKKVG